MPVKLTLSVEKSVIERAKRFSRRQNKSLSKLVEGYLRKLTGARKAGDDRLFSLYRDLIGSFPNLHLVPFDARIAEISSDLRARYDLPTPDAIQVATALQQGAETFVTNDARLKRAREIKVTLPRKAG